MAVNVLIYGQFVEWYVDNTSVTVSCGNWRFCLFYEILCN